MHKVHKNISDKVPGEHYPRDHQLHVPADHPVGVRLSAEPTKSSWQNAHVPRGQPFPGPHLPDHHHLHHVQRRGEKGKEHNVQSTRLVANRYAESACEQR